MKKRLLDLNQTMLTHAELHCIRGGFFRIGPGEVVDDDIDLPDLQLAGGPGEVVDDDIDLPDLSLAAGIAKAFSLPMAKATI